MVQVKKASNFGFRLHTLVNLDNGLDLIKKITAIETSLKTIEWLSPLTNDVLNFEVYGHCYEQWPMNYFFTHL